jgi:hypothetical protein
VNQGLRGRAIVEYFSKHFNVPESELPKPNRFLAQFKIWGFPPPRQQRSQEEETKLVARVREMFSLNYDVQDIQKTLNDEGWQLDDYRFRVLRKKYGLLKRSGANYAPLVEGSKKRKQVRIILNLNCPFYDRVRTIHSRVTSHGWTSIFSKNHIYA